MQIVHSLQEDCCPQQMGQLPAACVTPSLPFSTTGIDYAGPFLMNKGHTRKAVIVKVYLCVFTCFSIKAVHLEIVSNGTTEAFLASLNCFVSRRGLPHDTYSDNGSNFGGAKYDLTSTSSCSETTPNEPSMITC